MYYFEVIGKPHGKARARVTKWGSYNPASNVMYTEKIHKAFKEQLPNYKLTEAPVMIEIKAIFEPVKSVRKRERAEMISGKIKPTKKPDIDNIAKSVLDGLNGLAYKDDNQVIGLVCDKMYGKVSKIIVTIMEVL